MNANEIREQILAAPDAEPGDEVKWTPDDQAWLDRFMLARDAFHAAAGELVPDWDRDNPNRLRLHLEVLNATGLQPEVFNNLMQMDEIRVVREAAKMKREEREALIAGLQEREALIAGLLDCTTDTSTLPRLNDRELAAKKYIIENGSVTGDVIAHAIGVSPPHFRNNIVPKLKAHGMKNDRGHDGYYFP